MKSYSPPYTITTNIVNLISQITEEIVKVEIDEKSIATPKLRKENRIKTLAGTLEIEGNYMGEEKITSLIDGKRVLGTELEISEVKGAIAAYKELENYNYRSVGDLLKAHNILMNSILTSAGEYRHVAVQVGKHIAPKAEFVNGLMNDLFNWLIESDEHPLIKSCVFHYEFEFIHPFSDGNGRIGRLWQSLILYNWRTIFSLIPTESIIRDNQESYYKALEDSGESGDSTIFVEFMLNVILDSIKSSVNSSVKSSVNTEDKILSFFRENPNATIKEIADKLELTTRAIEKQISSLKANGRLTRVGSARKGTWVVNE